jgi:predicted transcriptional regulator
MTIEDKLKDLILKRYHSVREFTMENDIPYTTIHSIFKRGIGNSSVNNVIKICKALGISADALADGEISPVKDRPSAPANDNVEITDILEDTKDALIHSGKITLDGNPIGKAGIESIIDAIDVGVEIAKRKKY